MIFAKVKEIQILFNQFFYELTENIKFSNNNEREEMITIFFINNISYLLKNLSDFEAIKDENDPSSFDKVLNNKIETYINILIKKYFEDMNKILVRCIAKNSVENQIEGVNFIESEMKKLTKNELKNVSQHFNNKFRDIFNSVKKDVFSQIKDAENAKKCFFRFLEEILNKYANFIDILRMTKNEDLISTIVGVQKLMIEISNLKKGI